MDWKRISRKRFVLFIFTNTLIDFNLSFSQIKFTFALTQLLFCLKVLFLLPMIDFLTFPNRYISWNINIFTPSVHSINFVTPCMACLLRDLPILSVHFLKSVMLIKEWVWFLQNSSIVTRCFHEKICVYLAIIRKIKIKHTLNCFLGFSKIYLIKSV